MNVAVDTTLDEAFGCWLWTGKLDKDGYGQVWRGRRPSYAHRVVYEQEVGPIADGLVLDHACRRRNCVAPHHLEPITQAQNEVRKSWRHRAIRSTCKAGHNLATNRIVTPEGGVVCRTCNHEARRVA